MTKKELLEILEPSFVKDFLESCLVDSHEDLQKKKELCVNKYALIEATLKFVPDNYELNSFSSIKDLTSRKAFKNFVCDKQPKDIEDKFNAILTDLNTRANEYACKNPEKMRQTATALAVRNEWLAQKQRKNHRIIFPIFIVLFIVFSLAATICAALDAFDFFAEGSFAAKLCAAIPAVAGALDFFNGVAFALYERNDDKKKRTMQMDFETAIGFNDAGVYIKNKKIKVKGNGNNFGIQNGQQAVSEDEKYEKFISNYKVKVKGDDNNFTERR